MPEWLTTANLVDAAGIAGFVLSFVLAVSQLWSNRLRVRATAGTLIETDRIRNSVFLHVCLYNKTSLPFSLLDVHVTAGRRCRNIPVERTVRTYYSKGKAGQKAPAGPVVLSREFPVQFDSYAAEVFLLEVCRQHIDTKFLHQAVQACSREEHPHRRSLHIHRLYRHRPLLRLNLHTSRGRLSVPVPISSIQGWDWLDSYAVQKAGHEEKIAFPP